MPGVVEETRVQDAKYACAGLLTCDLICWLKLNFILLLCFPLFKFFFSLHIEQGVSNNYSLNSRVTLLLKQFYLRLLGAPVTDEDFRRFHELLRFTASFVCMDTGTILLFFLAFFYAKIASMLTTRMMATLDSLIFKETKLPITF